MSLPVASAAYRVPTGHGVDDAIRARVVEPLRRVEMPPPCLPPGDGGSAPPCGPAALLVLTPLGEAVLRVKPRNLVVNEARLALVRRLIAAEGYTPDAVERAARALTLA